ncbi:MAG: hypothetical protein ACR2RE_28190 [Geminicoccaceae bacterium]
MKDKHFSLYQEVQLLFCLLCHSGEDGEVAFQSEKVQEDISKIETNCSFLEEKLFELNEEKVVHFEMVD